MQSTFAYSDFTTVVGTGARAGDLGISADYAIALGYRASSLGAGAVSLGADGYAGGVGSIAIGQNANAARFDLVTLTALSDNIAIGRNSSATANNAVALGAGSVADRANSVSVGAAGAERQITNVAAGTQATDAVNLGQLNVVAAAAAAAQADATAALLAAGSPSPYFNVNSAGPPSQAVGGNAIAVGQNSIAGGTSSVAMGDGALASGEETVAIGRRSSAGGDDSVAIGTGASASAAADDGVAIGNGATVSAANAVALGSGSVADQANTVSVGAAGAERRIINVAAGTAGTDAVNVDQLNAVAALAGNGSAAAAAAQTSANAAQATANTALANGAYFRANSTGPVPQATGTDAIAVGTGATCDRHQCGGDRGRRLGRLPGLDGDRGGRGDDPGEPGRGGRIDIHLHAGGPGRLGQQRGAERGAAAGHHGPWRQSGNDDARSWPIAGARRAHRGAGRPGRCARRRACPAAADVERRHRRGDGAWRHDDPAGNHLRHLVQPGDLSRRAGLFGLRRGAGHRPGLGQRRLRGLDRARFDRRPGRRHDGLVKAPRLQPRNSGNNQREKNDVTHPFIRDIRRCLALAAGLAFVPGAEAPASAQPDARRRLPAAAGRPALARMPLQRPGDVAGRHIRLQFLHRRFGDLPRRSACRRHRRGRRTRLGLCGAGPILLSRPSSATASTSTGYGNWPRSIAFRLDGRRARRSEIDSCPANSMSMSAGESLTCSCEPGSTETGQVWGSGPYTSDSGVCRAALHAGVIDADGGTLRLRALPGRSAYAASRRNGVATRGWGANGGSFDFDD